MTVTVFNEPSNQMYQESTYAYSDYYKLYKNDPNKRPENTDNGVSL